MNSFQSSLKGVLSGWGVADVVNPQRTLGPWPAFKLAPSPRPERSTTEKLARIVEREIIPRLMMANRPSSNAPAPEARPPVRQNVTPTLALDGNVIEAFTWSVLERTALRMNAYVNDLLHDGVSEAEIYSHLIAPSAFLLVDLWSNDSISYVEVTVSLNRLQQLCQGFDDEVAYNGHGQVYAHSALFAPSPGGQHTFGLYLIEELFRWSGWRTWVEIKTDSNDVGAKARCQWFDAVCLNVTREADIEAVSATIDIVRRVSRNRDLYVLAYGPLCVERPSLVGTIGAHAAASNANEALRIIDRAMTCPAVD
jgi:methanogenic corrinoid protein MtbC1